MDALDLVPNKTISCLDDIGLVQLIDVMPRIVPVGQTCDYAIAQAARVSYGDGTKSVNEDKGLIRYLMRHSHSTPSEMVVFKFRIKVPIFVSRQMCRHRMMSMNEISGRYSVMKDEFYFPNSNELRKQSKTNKQGSEGTIDDIQSAVFAEGIKSQCKSAYDLYLRMLDAGVAREQARMVLPLNLYTEFYWKQDLHNLLHFLALRLDPHAQYEIRVYAQAMHDLIKNIVPWTIEAWEDYHIMRGAVKLTSLEVDAIKKHNLRREMNQDAGWIGQIDSDNKREKSEWFEKATDLGFNILD
jgi:thymidylate synthase (FAD)